jgi:hypothetical protein
MTVTCVSGTIQPPDTSIRDWMPGAYYTLVNVLDPAQLGR